MRFDVAVNTILMHEGNYVWDSNDPGGETRFGISKRSFPNENIKDLSLERAKEIYKKYYWNACRCDDIPDWAVLIVFDCAVNQGVARAVAYAQKTLIVPVDGVLGPITIKAWHSIDYMDFLEEYAKLRLNSYTRLPHWKYYGAGWAKRLLDIVLRSFRYAGDSPGVPINTRA